MHNHYAARVAARSLGVKSYEDMSVRMGHKVYIFPILLIPSKG